MLDPCKFHPVVFIVVHLILNILHISGANEGGARANVTLRLALNYDIDPECDETVYKAVICVGEFTNECLHLGPVARFLQASCASQSAPEPITFLLTSVDSPIELDVTVQRVGENSVQRLRRTEFRLTEGREITVTSFDLSLIVRFYADYFCLPNYFGRVCNKFCNTTAVDHVCDEWGNPICRSGYFPDSKTGTCRRDQCISQPNYCKNGGTCVTNPDPLSPDPLCLCTVDFVGAQCDTRQLLSTSLAKLTTLALETSEATTMNNTELAVKGMQSRASIKKNDKASRSLINLSPPNLTSVITEVQSHDVQSEGYISAAVELNAGAEQFASKTNHQDLAEQEDKIQSTFGETEPGYKKFILPALVVVLMLSLLIACIAFLAWAITQRKRKKDINKPKNFGAPDVLPIINSSQLWTSADQSPTRLYPPFESSIFGTPHVITPLSEAQYSFSREPVANESNYGVPPSAGFYPPGYFPTTEATNSFNLCTEFPWTREPNRFSTIPRPYSTFGRRSATDTTLLSAPHSPLDPSAQVYNLADPLSMGASWMSPRLQSNTIPGSFQLEHRQSPSIYITTSEAMERPASGQHCCRVPSLHNVSESFQPTTMQVYRSVVPVCEPNVSTSMKSTRATPTLESFAHNSTNTENQLRGVLETAHPPPPREFADVYPESHC